MHRLPLSPEDVRQLLADTEVSTWVWDVKADRVFGCVNMARLFGIELDEAAQGTPIEKYLRIIHPEDRSRVEAQVGQALRGQAGLYESEYRLLKPDGALTWVSVRGKVEHDEEGKPVRFPGVAFDITERRRAEEDLVQAKDRAEASSRAKDEFLAVLSHELRTPLTPVLLSAAALSANHTLPKWVREQHDMIQRNITLEARLIDDLLDLTHIARGTLTLRPEPCDVHSLIGRTLGIVRSEVEGKGTAINLELEAPCHHLMGDITRLQQVMWNLLRNAVKFTPAGERICLRTRNRTEAASAEPHLVIEVEDNGIGFEPEATERIFNTFEQAHRGQQRQFGGLGLGLAIARAVIKLHQGRIWAQSAGPGQGATFTVELPGSRLSTKAALLSAAPPNTGASTLPPLRLLLVEDDEETRRALDRLLRRRGHRVVTAGNSSQALAAAERQKFDAVVSDLGLPDGTGHELMRTLRERHALGGVAISGYGAPEDIRRSQEAGFRAHLTKPLALEELLLSLAAFAPSDSRVG